MTITTSKPEWRNMKPMFFGLTIGVTVSPGTVGLAQAVHATSKTNGLPMAHTVQKVCVTISEDPPVWNQFGGPQCYIMSE